MSTVGFVGGGRITAIFITAWRAKGIPVERIVVSDPDPSVREQLRALHPGIEITQDNSLPMTQETVFLALHPPVMRTLLPELAAALPPKTTVVSLAPVVGFAELSAGLNGHQRLVRMIPNAPSLIGMGYNPVAYGTGLPKPEQGRLFELFAALGECPLVPEAELNAHAVLTAMGPTYFWPQWQVMRELGHSFGLDAETTDHGLAAMLHGAVTQLLERGLAFEAVMDTIPVKPLAEVQAGIQTPFRERLPALYAKLTSATMQHA